MTTPAERVEAALRERFAYIDISQYPGEDEDTWREIAEVAARAATEPSKLPLKVDIGKVWVTRPHLESSVLEWLRKHHEGASFEVTELVEVRPVGDDFAGPEDDYYARFYVDLTYRTTDPNRPTLYLTVEGRDLESLWRHVVGGVQ